VLLCAIADLLLWFNSDTLAEVIMSRPLDHDY
jgi:hypothetical protein